MQVRCAFLCLSFAFFLGSQLLLDELFGTAAEKPEEMATSSDSIWTADGGLFKGRFRFRANGTEVLAGPAKAAIRMRDTGAPALKVNSVLLNLQGARRSEGFAGLTERVQDLELAFHGLSFESEGRILASGLSEETTVGHLPARGPCRFDAVLTWHNATTEDEESAGFRAELISQSCGFTVLVEVRSISLDHVARKVSRYAAFTNILTFVQIRCYAIQMRDLDGLAAGRLSMLTVAAQALMDAFDSFLHLGICASSHFMFNTLAFLSLMKFVLFSLFQVRLMLTVWRHWHEELLSEGWEAFRRELTRAYSYFYFVLLGGLLIIFHALDQLDFIVLVFQAQWLPQIVFSVKQGTKPSTKPVFLLGIAATRCLTVFYLWGCPECLFNGDLFPKLPRAPSSNMCIATLTLQAVQVGLLISLKQYGPWWFIPWVCLPDVYNYKRPVQAGEADADAECVICMQDLCLEDGAAVAPCDHKFHKACLETWMDVKMECPTCRRPLPPMI